MQKGKTKYFFMCGTKRLLWETQRGRCSLRYETIAPGKLQPWMLGEQETYNIYAGCPRRNVPDFGRLFLMLKYTDITQKTYIQG
jgi:hypothetical protein